MKEFKYTITDPEFTHVRQENSLKFAKNLHVRSH